MNTLLNILFAGSLIIANTELLFLLAGDTDGRWEGVVIFFTSPFLFLALVLVVVRIFALNIAAQSKFSIAFVVACLLMFLWSLLFFTVSTRFFGEYEVDRNIFDAVIVAVVMVIGYVFLYIFYLKIGNSNLSSEYIVNLSKKYAIGFVIALFVFAPYASYVKSKNREKLLHNNETRLSQHIAIEELGKDFASSSLNIYNLEKITRPEISTNLYRVDGNVEDFSEITGEFTKVKTIYYIVDPVNRRVSQVNPGGEIVWSNYTGDWR